MTEGNQAMDIVEFIEARVAEDEAAAQQQTAIGHHPKEQDDRWIRYADPRVEGGRSRIYSPYRTPTLDNVLQQCSHIKGMLLWHTENDYEHLPDGTAGTCEGCGPIYAWPCRELKMAASIWSDHPDFDPSWTLTGDTSK